MYKQFLNIILVASVSINNIHGDNNAKRVVHPRQTEIKFTNFATKTQQKAVPILTTPQLFRSGENYFHTQFENRQTFPDIQQNFVRVQTTPQLIKTPIIQQKFAFGSSVTHLEDILELEWNNFKRTFNKTYGSFAEERQRKEIFIENRNKISKFNQDYGIGLHSFVQKLNSYSDMLHHEFNQQVNGFNRTAQDKVPPEVKPSTFIKSANSRLPIRIDWREIGAVSQVKSQGTCGACYAFAAAGALEGQHFRKTGNLIELSPQNIVDCSTPYSNNGCIGGVMEYTYEYIKDNKGIATEKAYPFEGRDELQCRYSQEKYGAHTTGYVVIDEADEQALESAVAHLGPVSVGIDASPPSFQFYADGVYFDPTCKSSIDTLNHAVLVVGYGTEPNGQEYWLIKNSYGPAWGIGGYMKIAKFSSNHCGIASYASYPLV